MADTAGTQFEVVPSVHPAAFEERWRLVLDDGQVLNSTALRAWDKTAERWMYTWVSDNGLYQVWEGRKDQHGWWIYRHFDVAGDRYLSRQGFFPLKDGERPSDQPEVVRRGNDVGGPVPSAARPRAAVMKLVRVCL